MLHAKLSEQENKKKKTICQLLKNEKDPKHKNRQHRSIRTILKSAINLV